MCSVNSLLPFRCLAPGGMKSIHPYIQTTSNHDAFPQATVKNFG